MTATCGEMATPSAPTARAAAVARDGLRKRVTQPALSVTTVETAELADRTVPIRAGGKPLLARYSGKKARQAVEDHSRTKLSISATCMPRVRISRRAVPKPAAPAACVRLPAAADPSG